MGTVDRSEIGVFQLDLRVEGSDRCWKVFWAKSLESTVEFVFGRSVDRSVRLRSDPRVEGVYRRQKFFLTDFGRSRTKPPE